MAKLIRENGAVKTYSKYLLSFSLLSDLSCIFFLFLFICSVGGDAMVASLSFLAIDFYCSVYARFCVQL